MIIGFGHTFFLIWGLDYQYLDRQMWHIGPGSKDKIEPGSNSMQDSISSAFSTSTCSSPRTKKLGALNTKNENQIISGSSKSTLADLVKFNTNLAHSFYNITDMATLEVFLLALQPKGPSSGSILHPQPEHPCPGGPHDLLPHPSHQDDREETC